MRRTSLTAITAAVLTAVAPMAAHASLTFSEGLTQFNAIVLGDAHVYSHVDGRTYVGGNLDGYGDFVQHPNSTPASSYTGLTVMGNAKLSSVNGIGLYVGGKLTGVNMNTGDSRIQGNVSNSNLNGSSAAIGGTVSDSNVNAPRLQGTAATTALANAKAVAESTDFASVFSQGSSFLSGLTGTGGTVSFENGGSKVVFNAIAGKDGVAIFDLSAIDDAVFAASEFSFNLNGAKSIIFNSDNSQITIGANFLGGSALSLGDQLLWNFYNASSVTLNSQFGGSLIATKATLTNNQNIEGTVVVQSLNQYGEIHLNPYTGTIPTSPIPEPSTYAMMGLGLALLAKVVAKRRSA